jgi:hypothetical protein
LLGTRSYACRFEQELRCPGAHVPFPRDAALFIRAADLGRRLLWLHTFGQRCVPPGSAAARVPAGDTRCIQPPEHLNSFAYDPEQHTLRVGGGAFGPLAPAVWDYSVSGLPIVRAWLRQRTLRKATRGRSQLDAIALHNWTPALTRELLEVIWVLEATIALEPQLDAVLDEIVSNYRSRM